MTSSRQIYVYMYIHAYISPLSYGPDDWAHHHLIMFARMWLEGKQDVIRTDAYYLCLLLQERESGSADEKASSKRSSFALVNDALGHTKKLAFPRCYAGSFCRRRLYKVQKHLFGMIYSQWSQ